MATDFARLNIANWQTTLALLILQWSRWSLDHVIGQSDRFVPIGYWRQHCWRLLGATAAAKASGDPW